MKFYLVSFFICAWLAVLGHHAAIGNSDFGFLMKDQARYEDVVVKQVLSTDTIVLEEGVGEREEVIQLIGLKAPSTPKTKKVDIERDQYGFTKKKEVSPLTPIEEQAIEFARELLIGQHVRLEFDVNKKSEDYGTLAYVFLLNDNTFVNTEILRHGFAHLQIRPPNTKYADILREAYREARAQKRGLQSE